MSNISIPLPAPDIEAVAVAVSLTFSPAGAKVRSATSETVAPAMRRDALGTLGWLIGPCGGVGGSGLSTSAAAGASKSPQPARPPGRVMSVGGHGTIPSGVEPVPGEGLPTGTLVVAQAAPALEKGHWPAPAGRLTSGPAAVWHWGDPADDSAHGSALLGMTGGL